MFLLDHTRHLLLLQGLFEDQQQGLSSGFGGPEGEEQAAGDARGVPSETSGGSVLRVGHQEIQAQETGRFVICSDLCSVTVADIKTTISDHIKYLFFTNYLRIVV